MRLKKSLKLKAVKKSQKSPVWFIRLDSNHICFLLSSSASDLLYCLSINPEDGRLDMAGELYWIQLWKGGVWGIELHWTLIKLRLMNRKFFTMAIILNISILCAQMETGLKMLREPFYPYCHFLQNCKLNLSRSHNLLYKISVMS